MAQHCTNHARPLFRLGRVLATPGALVALRTAGISALSLLVRHLQGDWGDLDDEDLLQNEIALLSGARLLSSYSISLQVKVWVITEADRSATTVLLPDDY